MSPRKLGAVLALGLMVTFANSFAEDAGVQPHAVVASTSPGPSVLLSSDAEITAFMLAYQRALTTGDSRFLAAHIERSVRVRWLDYSMETHVHVGQVRSAAQAHRWRDRIGLARWFVDLLGRGERFTGEPLCPTEGTPASSDADELAPYRQGQYPYDVRVDSVRVRFVVNGCGAGGHIRILTFRREARGLVLSDVEVELPY